MTNASDRRSSCRRLAMECPRVSAVRLRPGRPGRLIDISCGGVCIETTVRLLPGTFVDLQLDVDGSTRTLRSRVLRCGVSALVPALVYRAALAFDRPLNLPHVPAWVYGGGRERRLPDG
jgi:hypothetical protein